MTHMQWVVEATALRKMEEQQRENARNIFESAVFALQESLIGILGLNIGAEDVGEDVANADELVVNNSNTDGDLSRSADTRTKDASNGARRQLPRFIPMVMSAGHPAIVSKLVEREKKKRIKDTAATDTASNALYEMLKNAPMDMTPILEELDAVDPLEAQREYDAMLRAIGVTPASDVLAAEAETENAMQVPPEMRAAMERLLRSEGAEPSSMMLVDETLEENK